MSDRWATFDCYGTLIDWNLGISRALATIWPGESPAALLAAYHEAEPRVEEEGPRPYREVLALCVREVATALNLAPGNEASLAESLAGWPPFPEVRGALEELRRRGWKLAVLSNTDPDLLASSIAAIGVEVDLRITVADAGSYKPALGHWRAFFERSGAARERHVHVAASLFHDIAPCAQLGIPSIWINRLGESSTLLRHAELRDLAALPDALESIVTT